jgi:uncharacterized protein YkwD
MIYTLTLCAALVFLFAEEKPTATNPSDKAPAATASESTGANKTEKGGETPSKAGEAKKTSEGQTEKNVEEKKKDDDDLLVIEANVVSYTNAERARYGLPPLQVDKNLMKTAREHCSWMTRMRSMVHTRLAVAENIAMGQPTSQDVVRTWMNSSGHRANILNPGNHRIGVAAYRTESGTIYWCQQFSQ